jgi:conjugal transfer mating pair stabilization protein TraN
MNRLLLCVLMSIFISNAYADDMQLIVNQTLAQSEVLKNDSYNHIKNFNPNTAFDHYSSNPGQTQYYSGTTQSDTSKLDQDVSNARSLTEAGNIVSSSISQHPNFVITKDDADISHSQFIQSDADNIIHGVTDRYVDCNATKICKATYQQKQCEEAPEDIFQSCKKTLNIDIIPHETTTHYTLVVHVTTDHHKYAGININAVTGSINFMGPRDTSFRLDGRLPSNLNCEGLQGSITQFNTNDRDTHLDYINFPTCSNAMSLDFHLTGSRIINLDMQIDVISKVMTYEVKDRWVENCDSLLHEPSCMFKSKTCNQPQSTRTFHNIPVTHDCWEESYRYICHRGSGLGNCKPLQSQGCEQIDSVCKEENNNECTLYQKTYQCPIQTCSNTANVTCGDGKSYCLDGNCVDHSYKPSNDFAKSISALSAVSDASKQLDPSSMTIFAGHSSECNEIPVGFSNCCTEEGWGQDVGLANCPLEAKILHEAREKGVVVKVGRYCSASGPIPCLEHSQVFCVFNSKLARIIQEQGRRGQLQIDFGSAQSPNCLGVTPDQLKSIDFGKIDFKEFYSDINTKQPDLNQIQQDVQQHVQKSQNAEQLNG